jgi:hypothetical protein
MQTIKRQTMTLRDLVTNPPGSGTSHVAARYRIKDSLDQLYRSTMADPALSTRFAIAAHKEGEKSFTAIVRVPSEKNATNFDVVFRFDYGESLATSQARCRLYCNSPSFVFTYGYVCCKNGLLIPGWEGALGDQVVKNPPKVRNPHFDFGYDKVVHQAALYVLGRGGMTSLRDAERLSVSSPPIDPRTPAFTALKKLKEYEKFEAIQAEERREERESARAEAKKEKSGERGLQKVGGGLQGRDPRKIGGGLQKVQERDLGDKVSGAKVKTLSREEPPK